MTRPLAWRLAMDLTAFVLLLVALAYYWLDNVAHEVIGTVMLAMVLVHGTLHRRWFRGVPQKHDTDRTIDKVLVLCLLAAMATLLATSVMISQTVFASVAAPDAIAARRLHGLAAYWALLLVAVHVGIRWRLVYAPVQTRLGLVHGRVRTALARGLAAVFAAAGVHGALQIGVADKLMAEVSLEWWDFSASTWGFFLHHLTFVGLAAYVSHHALRWIRKA